MTTPVQFAESDAIELRDFVENINAPLHWAGPDGVILWANQAELDLLGYTRDEYVGHHLAEFHADPDVAEDLLVRLRRDEQVQERAARMRHKDGSIRYVLISASVLWRNGEFVHTRCLTIDNTERRRAARHLAAEYAVTRILAKSRDLDQLFPQLLQAICEVGEWQLGVLWNVDEEQQLLRCVDVWHAPDTGLDEFGAATRQMTFRPGVGLPGRVWAEDRSAWIEAVHRDGNFLRQPAAGRAGLNGGYAFPIHARGRITGVLEFFSTAVRPPEPDLMQLLDAIGTQIGPFVERREVEETRERLAAIVDSSEDAIVSKTLDGIVTSWNRGAEKIFGYTAAEAIGRSITLIIPPERRAEEDEVLSRLRRGEKIQHFETERLAKDGRRLNISLSVSPVRNAAGRIVGAAKVARDVTAQKKAVDALRESERRTREQARLTDRLNQVGAAVASTLDTETVAQTVTDLAAEITSAEYGAFFYGIADTPSGETSVRCALTGLAREALAGCAPPQIAALFEPTSAAGGLVRLDDVTADPRASERMPYAGMAPGHQPIRSYLAVPVRARSGGILGGLFFGHSKPGMFTPQHAQLVEGAAVWASMAMENARLYAEAEHAVHARDEFLSIASHELRNPLNALQLQLVALHRAALEGSGPLPRQWVCDRVGQATEDVARLVRLVYNLLDVSRITSGRIDLEPEDLEFGRIVEAVVARFKDQFKENQVALDMMTVRGRWDRLRVDQIVTNLLSNALKYGNGKRVEVTLRANKDEDTVTFSVRDYGIGIDPANQERLFKRFERAVSRQKYGGFGLGLWITREIVDAMGGSIRVDSQAGRGSTFTVTLPRTAAPQPGARAS